MNITHNATEYFIRAELNCEAQITSTLVDYTAESAVGSSISWNGMVREASWTQESVTCPPFPCAAWVCKWHLSFLQLPVLLCFSMATESNCSVVILPYDCALLSNDNLAVKQHTYFFIVLVQMKSRCSQHLLHLLTVSCREQQWGPGGRKSWVWFILQKHIFFSFLLKLCLLSSHFREAMHFCISNTSPESGGLSW